MPEALLTYLPRLLGLDNRKMSKSFDNTVNLSDSPDTVKKKIQNMFTDPKRIRLSDPGHPDECNVFTYYKVFIPGKEKEVYNWCKKAKRGCTDCKRILAQGLIERLEIHQEKRKTWTKNEARLQKILKDGAQRAGKVATQTINEIKRIIAIP